MPVSSPRSRGLSLAAFLAAALLLPRAARAFAHPYGSLDVFLPTDASDGMWKDGQAIMVDLSGLGYDSLGTLKTKAALGARLGLMFDVSDSFSLGASAGYITGPNAQETINLSGGPYTGTIVDDRSVHFVRGLMEALWTIPFADVWAVRLGGGLGYAQGQVQEDFSCSGSACIVQGKIFSGSSTWSGTSWEVSPALSYGGLFFGLRYSQFPKFSGNAHNSAIDWTSSGIFTGLMF